MTLSARVRLHHLPGLGEEVDELHRTGPEAAPPLHPRLTPALLDRLGRGLVDAGREVLGEVPWGRIVDAVDEVAQRLLDGRDPLRVTAEALLPGTTGYSGPMVREVLDRMAADWRAPRLRELVRVELGGPEALDTFVLRDGERRSRAFGPRLLVHSFAGNVPGVAVTSLVRGLLVRAPSLGKTAREDPVLPALFARGLAEADPDLGRCLAVAYWPGDDAALREAALAHAEVVVAYGGGAAVRAVRDAAPAEARFLAYGHRLSLGLVCREGLTPSSAPALAREVARAVALFDQRGCVSPRTLFVEEGGEVAALDWSSLLADALAGIEEVLPRGRPDPGAAAEIRRLRSRALFEELAGTGVRLLEPPGSSAWTVIYDPRPGFAPSCPYRTVTVRPVGELAEVEDALAPLAGILQTAGLAAPPQRREEIASRLGRLGVTRVCPFAEVPFPPPTWHHDGIPPLAALVRWCDLEPGGPAG